MPPSAALALSEQQILEKLSSVPVFLIADEEGNWLRSGDTEEIVVFIDAVGAEAVASEVTEDENFTGELQIVPFLLSEVYEGISAQSGGAESLSYFPALESWVQASEIAEREIDGVPLFAIVNEVEGEVYLPTVDETIPLYFSFSDIQSDIANLVENNPELEESIGIQMFILESLLADMSANDSERDEFLEQVRFIAPSQTLQLLESISEEVPASGEVPAADETPTE